MKKILKLSFVALACALLAVSCNKAGNDITPDNPKDENPAGKVVTISARLSEALTKVAFTPDVDASKAILKLTWEDTDKLIVADHANPSTTAEFTLVSGNGTAEATFRGTLPAGATSYDVSIKNSGAVEYNTIQQAADNDASHLEYIAAKKDITDLDSVEFDEICGVLGITAKLPAGVAATVRTVSIVASENIFNSGNTLTIELETAKDEGDDDILRLYAPLPATSQAITTGTTLLIRFNNRYTRFITLGGSPLTPGKLNEIKVNCSHTDQYAGGNGTSTDNAYLIGDKYQMDAMHQLMQRNEMKYFKLIDSIDMTGIVWFPLNNGYPESGGTQYTGNVYDKALDFNGNGKTISNLSTKSTGITSSDEYASIFGVLMGNVYDLTIDNAKIYPQRKSGILAGYVGTGTYGPSHCEVNNITIKNSKLENGGSYCGALAGQSAKNGNVFSNITITDCTVSTTGYAAGLIASISSSATVSDITIQGTNVSSTGSSNTATPVPDDGIAGGIAAVVKAKVDFDRCEYKNATITGPKNTNESPSTNSRYLGGLAGYVYDNATTFDDCKVNTVTLALNDAGSNNNGRYIGGAFGYLGESVVVGETTGCIVNKITINNNVRNYVGGFVGLLSGGSVKNSSASGSISALGGCGGFIGQCDGGILADNTSSVAVTGTGNIGGFVGIITVQPSFTRCTNLGNVTANGTSAGGFVGRIMADSNASFEFCHVGNNTTCPTVTQNAGDGNYFTGGFAGNVESVSSFKNCDVKVQIPEPTNGVKGIGGFVGHTKTGRPTFDICHVLNGSSINGKGNWVGGFAGYIESGAEFSSCSSACNVSATAASYVGGFVGYAAGNDSKDQYINCTASGTVLGNNHVGGFVGNANGQKYSGCAYEGTSVTATIASKNAMLGGFVGRNQTNVNVFENCHVGDGSNEVTVYTANGQRVGGFVGQNENLGSTFTKCYVKNAKVSGQNNTGGFVGVQYGPIEKSYVKGGTVTSLGGGNVAGFSAFMQYETTNLTNCYSTADVDGKSFSNVGGLVGIANNSAFTISFCYATGAVSGTGTNRGGLIGRADASAIVEKCISWNSSLPLSGTSSENINDCYVKLATEEGSVSSHAQEAPRSWSSTIWDFSDDLPTLK